MLFTDFTFLSRCWWWCEMAAHMPKDLWPYKMASGCLAPAPRCPMNYAMKFISFFPFEGESTWEFFRLSTDFCYCYKWGRNDSLIYEKSGVFFICTKQPGGFFFLRRGVQNLPPAHWHLDIRRESHSWHGPLSPAAFVACLFFHLLVCVLQIFAYEARFRHFSLAHSFYFVPIIIITPCCHSAFPDFPFSSSQLSSL